MAWPAQDLSMASFREFRVPRRNNRVRNPAMIVGGAALFIVGLVLISGILDWLLNVAGILTAVAGVVVFGAGVWNAARKK